MVLDNSVFEHAGNERAVVAAIFSVPNSIILISDTLKDTDFLTSHNRLLFVAAISLYKGDGITHFDITTVVEKCKSIATLEQCGGIEYITALFNTPILEDNIKVFVNSVLENSSRKLMYDKLELLKQEVLKSSTLDNQLPASELLIKAHKVMSEVSSHASRVDEIEDISAGLVEYIQDLGQKKELIRGLPTGFDRLDERINGLIPGSLTILAARPKCGKTQMLTAWAAHLAYDLKVPVLYIDTEMTTLEIKSRLLSSLSGVPERQIVNGAFVENKDSLDRVKVASDIMNSGGFYHKYTPGIDVDKIYSLTRKAYATLPATENCPNGIGALFFDYIKLPDISSLKNVAEHQMLGHITAALKDLAGILNIPVVTAAQVGRTGSDKEFISSTMVADSDRLLRYCSTLLGLSRKTEELKKKKEEMSDMEFKKYMRDYGTHRLQILEARAGGALFEGINITARPWILRMEESAYQPHDSRSEEQEETF